MLRFDAKHQSGEGAWTLFFPPPFQQYSMFTIISYIRSTCCGVCVLSAMPYIPLQFEQYKSPRTFYLSSYIAFHLEWFVTCEN